MSVLTRNAPALPELVGVGAASLGITKTAPDEPPVAFALPAPPAEEPVPPTITEFVPELPPRFVAPVDVVELLPPLVAPVDVAELFPLFVAPVDVVELFPLFVAPVDVVKLFPLFVAPVDAVELLPLLAPPTLLVVLGFAELVAPVEAVLPLQLQLQLQPQLPPTATTSTGSLAWSSRMQPTMSSPQKVTDNG